MKVRDDLTGLQFGKLTMIRPVGADKRRRSIWLAHCSCGSETQVIGTRVKSGHVSSCGCEARNKPLDLTGQRFERLVALYPVGENSSRARVWLCVCDCGTLVKVPGPKLKFGHTRSCGCLQVDVVRERSLTHGMSNTSLYARWLGMWARCTNQTHASFKNYGARGIKVCDRWRSFENFYWDMGDAPENMSIDRINNDGDYEPKNCRWATRAEQSANSRRWQ